MQSKPMILTLFGATGDLAFRKLYPALFRLYQNDYLGSNFAVIGTARSQWAHGRFRRVVKNAILPTVDDPTALGDFIQHFYYISHDVTDEAHYSKLHDLIDELDHQYNAQGNRLFYLSMAPEFFPIISRNLKEQQVLSTTGYNRLIIEKPFGHDLASSQKLQEQLAASFDEEQIYRIDHYLGKETVQAIYNLRFRNLILKQLWNKDNIESVHIYVNERVGVGERAGYYERSGAIRDMFQNHILQLVALIAMRQPNTDSPDAISHQKTEVLRHLRYFPSVDEAQKNIVLGQYGPNHQESTKGYRQERNVDPESMTETFFAARLFLDLPEWQDVPFIVQTGKRLESKYTAIEVNFKQVSDAYKSNKLTIHIDPKRGYTLRMNHKVPGYTQGSSPVDLKFRYDQHHDGWIPEDYERLILESLQGNRNYFVHQDEVYYAWKYVDHLLQLIEQMPAPNFPNYTAYSYGPFEMQQLFKS